MSSARTSLPLGSTMGKGKPYCIIFGCKNVDNTIAVATASPSSGSTRTSSLPWLTAQNPGAAKGKILATRLRVTVLERHEALHPKDEDLPATKSTGQNTLSLTVFLDAEDLGVDCADLEICLLWTRGNQILQSLLAQNEFYYKECK